MVQECLVSACETDVIFFSSGGRHTRSLRDWSSDVCSSDLVMTARQLVPPVFLLTLGATAILARWVGAARVVFAATAAAYLLSVLGCSVVAGRKAGLRTIAGLALVFPVVHVSYGFGFLRCVLDLAVRSRRLASRATLPLSR